jgi:hypothetical protein
MRLTRVRDSSSLSEGKCRDRYYHPLSLFERSGRHQRVVVIAMMGSRGFQGLAGVSVEFVS